MTPGAVKLWESLQQSWRIYWVLRNPSHTPGGTDPLTSHGHRKADARRIKELLEARQHESRPT